MRRLIAITQFICSLVVGAFIGLAFNGGAVAFSGDPSAARVRTTDVHYEIGDRGEILSIDAVLRGNLPAATTFRYQLREGGPWSGQCAVTIKGRNRGLVRGCPAPSGSTAEGTTRLSVVVGTP